MKSLDIESIAKEHSTPFYLIDLESARESFFRIRKLFPENTITAYATKANYSPSIIKLFSDLNLYFDTFTAGEVKHLLNCGVDAEKIMYTSVTETKGEFEFVLSRGVRFFVIGSLNGLYNLKEVTAREKIDVDILLRVQPIEHVKAGTSTSGMKSKFGILFDDGKDSVRNILPKINGNLNFKGFHFHLGTQVADPNFYVKAIDRVMEYVMKNEIDIKILDIGGGYPFQYSGETPPIEKFGEVISKSIDAWRQILGNFKLIIEPGRSLVAGSTIFVARVVNIKELYGRKIIIIDAGDDMVMVKRHKVEPSIKVLSSSEEKKKYLIAGNLCHSADWIVEEPTALPRVEPGDLIIFENVGAYVMNHNLPYGLRKKPKVLVMEKGEILEEKHPFDIICGLE